MGEAVLRVYPGALTDAYADVGWSQVCTQLVYCPPTSWHRCGGRTRGLPVFQGEIGDVAHVFQAGFGGGEVPLEQVRDR